MEQARNLKTGIKHKDTPTGTIPVDWEAISLGQITKFEYGESLLEQKRKEGNVEVYGSNGLIGYHNEYIANGPGMIIGRKGSVGAVTWVDRNFWAIDTTYYITKNQTKEDLRWLFYSLLNRHLERLNAATGVPGLNREEAYSEIIPRPPLPEQKKIVEILTTVDEAIEKTAQIIEKAKKVKKGLMQKLLTRGIGHKHFKKTKFGEIPVDWGISKLGNLIIGRPEYGASTSAIDKNHNLPRYIRITDITDDGKLLGSTWKSIEKEFAKPYILKEGDFLFARSGATVGKTYLYKREDGECAFAGYMIRFKTNPIKIMPEFLFHYTHSSHYYNWVKGMLREGAQPNINATEYSNIPLLKPPIEEQKKMVVIFNSLDEEIEKEKSHKNQLEALKKGLMQVLLTGKIRIQV